MLYMEGGRGRGGNEMRSSDPGSAELNGRYSLARRLVYHGAMNLGFGEMIFIFVLALIIFGPKKMPEIGRQIGRALAEFKRASNEFKAQIETEIQQMEVETNVPSYISEPAAPPEHTLAAGAGEVAGESSPAELPAPELIPPAKGPDA